MWFTGWVKRKDEAACWEAGELTLPRYGWLLAPEQRAGQRAGFAKGAGTSQRRRASCVPSLPCSQPAYPAAPQRYLKSNVVRITRSSAYGAAAQRGETATPLRRRGACGAGRERCSVSGVGAESCKQAGQGGCASVHLPKELLL